MTEEMDLEFLYGTNEAAFIRQVSDADRYVHHGRHEYRSMDLSSHVRSPFPNSPYFELYQHGKSISPGFAEQLKIAYEAANWAQANYYRTEQGLIGRKLWLAEQVDRHNEVVRDKLSEIEQSRLSALEQIDQKIEELWVQISDANENRYRLFIEVEVHRCALMPDKLSQFFGRLDVIAPLQFSQPAATTVANLPQSTAPATQINGFWDRWKKKLPVPLNPEAPAPQNTNGVLKAPSSNTHAEASSKSDTTSPASQFPNVDRLGPEAFAREAGVSLDSRSPAKTALQIVGRALAFFLAIALGPFVGIALFSKLGLISGQTLLLDIRSGENFMVWAAAFVGIAIFASGGWFVERACRELAFLRYSSPDSTRPSKWAWGLIASAVFVGFLGVLVLDTVLQHEGILQLMPRSASEAPPSGFHFIYAVMGASIIFAYLCLKATSGLATGREDGKYARCQTLADEWYRRKLEPLLDQQYQARLDAIASTDETVILPEFGHSDLLTKVKEYARFRARSQALMEEIQCLLNRREELSQMYVTFTGVYHRQLQDRPPLAPSDLEAKQLDRAHDQMTFAIHLLDQTATALALIVDKSKAKDKHVVNLYRQHSENTAPRPRRVWWNPFTWFRRG